MLLRVISAKWELYNREVTKVLLPTESGIIGILPWHMNLTTILVSGLVVYVPVQLLASNLESFADYTETIDIEWWMAMIEDDIVTIAAE